MSLITRCPSCGTQFRVVADQLRISEGWVRCGRCQDVFDATQALQTAALPAGDAPAMPPATQPEAVREDTLRAQRGAASAPVSAWPDAASPAQPLTAALPSTDLPSSAALAAATPQAAHSGYELPSPPEPESFPDLPWQASALEIPPEPDLAVLSADAWLAAPLREEPAPDLTLAPAVPVWEPTEALPAEAAQAVQWSQAWLAVKTVPAAAPVESLESDVAEPVQPPSQTLVEGLDAAPSVSAAVSEIDAPIPSFVKQAQRKAWWSQPAVRFVMGMLVTLLPLALLLQIAIHERNQLAAWQPQWRPALQAMCVALRCELAPRQDIASVVLTGSSFNQEAQPYHYRLGLSMQNQSGAAVAAPAVELTLMDTQGQTLVRKVLLPAEMGVPVELAARSEWNGSLPVATQGLQLPVSGYRVLAFYP